MEKSNKALNLQQERLHNDSCQECGCPHEICCYSRGRKLSKIDEKLLGHYLKKANLLEDEVNRLKKEWDAIEARATAEMLKEVDEMIKYSGAALPPSKFGDYRDGYIFSLNRLKQRLRTQSGDDGK